MHHGGRTCEMTCPVPPMKLFSALLMGLLWAAALGPFAAGAQAGVFFTNLHSFGVSPDGANPNGLVLASDGNFYGTTGGATYDGYAGGVFYGGGGDGPYGTVFRITSNGALTALYSFTGANDGAYPNGLVQGSDGNLYGTTSGGGTNNFGTVFKISTNGALTSLYSFTGTNDGGYPYAALVQGSDGNFYGTTSGMDQSSGATLGNGTVFRISTNGALTTLHSFTGTNGAAPQAALVQGSDGNFYGTTLLSSAARNGDGSYGQGNGTVFTISTNGALTTLYSFTGGVDGGDGAGPYGLVQGSDGNFYGTTASGGAFQSQSWQGDFGAVFRISTNGVLTTLYWFGLGNYNGSGPPPVPDYTDGMTPAGGLVQGSDGNFYGTTYNGGTNGWGTVFRVSTNGAYAKLYSFTGTNDGAYPYAGLVQGSDGNLYGTTRYGGPGGQVSGGGTVFKIGTNGVLSSLYSFIALNDGASPQAGLVQGSDGNFYGTTTSGGTNGGNGTVFKMSADGVLTSLYSFTGGDLIENLQAALVQGSDGNFYGTTPVGGTNGAGSVFRISTNGVLTTLYSFTGRNDGVSPQAGLVAASGGSLYGTTSGWNGHDGGTVFKVSTNGALRTLHSFTGTSGGAYPNGLVQGRDGNFYGTTEYSGLSTPSGSYLGSGTVFRMSANGALTTLYSFGRGLYDGDGAYPQAGLVQGGDGNFYGTTPFGGTNGGGTVFKISPNGVLTILYSLNNGGPGSLGPTSGLVQGSDGILYGTISGNGAYYSPGGYGSFGSVFKISTNGALTTLYSFTGGRYGTNPNAGLVQGRDGSFYGTTSSGGPGGVGTVFRLTVVRVAPVLYDRA